MEVTIHADDVVEQEKLSLLIRLKSKGHFVPTTCEKKKEGRGGEGGLL